MPLVTSSLWMLVRSRSDYGEYIELYVLASYLSLGTVLMRQNSLPIMIGKGEVSPVILLKILLILFLSSIPAAMILNEMLLLFTLSFILRPFFDVYFSLKKKFSSFYWIFIGIELIKIISAMSVESLESVIKISQGFQIFVYSFFTFLVFRECYLKLHLDKCISFFRFIHGGLNEMKSMLLRSFRGNIVVLFASLLKVSPDLVGIAHYSKRMLEGMSGLFKFKEYVATSGSLLHYSKGFQFILFIFSMVGAFVIALKFDILINWLSFIAVLSVWLKWKITSQRAIFLKIGAWKNLYRNELVMLSLSMSITALFLIDIEAPDLVCIEFILSAIFIYLLNEKDIQNIKKDIR